MRFLASLTTATELSPVGERLAARAPSSLLFPSSKFRRGARETAAIEWLARFDLRRGDPFFSREDAEAPEAWFQARRAPHRREMAELRLRARANFAWHDIALFFSLPLFLSPSFRAAFARGSSVRAREQ